MHIGIHVFSKMCLELEMMCPQNFKTIDQYKTFKIMGLEKL